MTDRKRDPLPEGYQFGDARPSEHLHVFNSISGYCECGLQYLPHMRPYFEFGGFIGDPPPRWMEDDRRRFVTVLPPGAVIETAKLSAWNVIEGEHFASDAERPPVVEGFIVNRDLGDEA